MTQLNIKREALRKPNQKKRKSCPFSDPNIPAIDYKDLKVLDKPYSLYSYYTDKYYPGGYVWHNHKRTCNLCGVLYLKTVKGCGIELRHNNDIVYFEPKNYDLLIFPGFLDHRPLMSLTKKRISLQFEIMCDM